MNTEDMRQHFEPDGSPRRLDSRTAGERCSVATGSAIRSQPTHEGRWLAHTVSGSYEADVREIVPGVFEALVHGYCWDYHPTCCLIGRFINWTPLPNTKV